MSDSRSSAQANPLRREQKITNSLDQEPPRRGGTFTMALESDFSSLDPLRVNTFVERQVALAVMDPLFDVDNEGNIVPVLAAGYAILKKGRVYRVKLREGIRFHDGTPLDADAVVFNIDRVRDPNNAGRCLPLVRDIESVRAIDPHTLEFKLNAPSAVLPVVLADAPGLMISPTAANAAPGAVATRPIGAGPFMLAEWQPGQRIVLARNPNYWDAGKPYLDRIVFVPQSNEDSRQAALLSGEADAIQTPSPRFVAQARENSDLTVTTSAGLGSAFLMMNTRNPPFDDVRVRRAIAHATDRSLLLKDVFLGQYPLADSLLGPGMWAHAPVPDYPQYDPARAMGLLAEYGKPVSFTLGISASPLLTLTALAFQRMWREAGIEAEIRQIANFMQDAATHRFQMLLYRLSGRPDPDLNLYGMFSSRYADQPSSNYTQYANPTVDELLELGRLTLDPAKRKAVYARLNSILAADVPCFYLFHSTAHTVLARKAHPGPNLPDGVLRLATAWKE